MIGTVRLAVCRVEYELAGKMKEQQVGLRHDYGTSGDEPPENPWGAAKSLIERHELDSVKVRRVALAGSVIVDRAVVKSLEG